MKTYGKRPKVPERNSTPTPRPWRIVRTHERPMHDIYAGGTRIAGIDKYPNEDRLEGEANLNFILGAVGVFDVIRRRLRELLDAEFPTGVPDGAASHWTDLRDILADMDKIAGKKGEDNV